MRCAHWFLILLQLIKLVLLPHGVGFVVPLVFHWAAFYDNLFVACPVGCFLLDWILRLKKLEMINIYTLNRKYRELPLGTALTGSRPSCVFKGVLWWAFCCVRVNSVLKSKCTHKMLLQNYEEDIKWNLAGRAANRNNFYAIFPRQLEKVKRQKTVSVPQYIL